MEGDRKVREVTGTAAAGFHGAGRAYNAHAKRKARSRP